MLVEQASPHRTRRRLLLSTAAWLALAGVAGAHAGPLPGDPPVYRTQLPPPVVLNYALRLGLFSGSGDLSWRPNGQRYEARLEGRIAGFNVLTQVSQGQLDRAGIAPLHHTDKRLRRPLQAARFERERGKITFSGPSTEYPLPAGAQDRLSWMIQLAAVAAADPQRVAPGGRVEMFVVGARGDANAWEFGYVGHETVETASGEVVRCAKFARESRQGGDMQVEVWLDPARHHLPVRAKLTTPSNGDSLELLLRELQSPP